MQSGRTRLRTWITRSKLSQKEAADLLSMHPVMLSQILGGGRKPGLPTAVNIEQVTGISVESWLLTPVSADEAETLADSANPHSAK